MVGFVFQVLPEEFPNTFLAEFLLANRHGEVDKTCVIALQLRGFSSPLPDPTLAISIHTQRNFVFILARQRNRHGENRTSSRVKPADLQNVKIPLARNLATR